MKIVALQFEDILQLLEFVEYSRSHNCPINLKKLTISCELSEADIELAINGFNAIVIESPTS